MSRTSAAIAATLGAAMETGREPIGWRLNPVQYAFVHNRARFSFYVGGIGAGKTYAGAVRAILRSQEQPRALGLVGAPTYPMLRDVTERTFFELLPLGLLGRYDKTHKQHLPPTPASYLYCLLTCLLTIGARKIPFSLSRPACCPFSPLRLLPYPLVRYSIVEVSTGQPACVDSLLALRAGCVTPAPPRVMARGVAGSGRCMMMHIPIVRCWPGSTRIVRT
jgi:hypothetical protein